ncbi:MAG: shikimate dehydrogenase [Chloroflexi bacterium HGW-Chloroflexi-5]|jgi:shikimate dehydrogenase|nr:MAG: shikimate dehydrogenase [Chloroflexi bacterium HGW-Chloroflexi-5]
MPENYFFGLIGYPLGHSVSPVLHLTALAEAGLKGKYDLFQVSPLPDGQEELEALINLLRSGELHGLNVTIPHKQSVFSLVDELTPSAAAIGAVNTLYMKSGQLVGDNTDAPGFWGDLSHLPIQNAKSALVLGAGGAARAVVYALLTHGWTTRITDLRQEQVDSLYTHFSAQNLDSSKLEVVPFTPQSIEQAGLESDLVVNATPMGMHPNIESCAWPEAIALPTQACIYDVVYNPMETRFLLRAAAAGLPCRNGLGMLVEQAVLAFERWTGFSPSRALMLEAVRP